MTANRFCKGSIAARIAVTLALAALTAAAIAGAARLSGTNTVGRQKTEIAESMIHTALGADPAAAAADWYRPRRPLNQIAVAKQE